ncbi:MAG: hypothetical protein IJF94_01240 [Eubacterium sp.]|nr:hypothetical protein [Eubacterium sp.]
MGTEPSEKDIDAIVAMLDGKTEDGVGRIKVKTSAGVMEGEMATISHHGRCDIGSPFCEGTADIDEGEPDNE